MLSWDFWRTRRRGCVQRRPESAGLERLETRELLAYSSLGISLPDLTVTGIAAPVAAWQNQLTVTVNVSNLGATTLADPEATFPGHTLTANAPATSVNVYASAHAHSFRGQVLIGTIPIVAGVPQNSLEQFTKTLTLPTRPHGFPGDGGNIFVHFVVNPTQRFLETNTGNNTSAAVPVQIEAPFPELQAVSLNLPDVMQPGDTISPNIGVENFGTVDTASQGPVTVILAASLTKSFGPGSSIIATYQIPNIPPLSTVPSQGDVIGLPGIYPRNNIFGIQPSTVPPTLSIAAGTPAAPSGISVSSYVSSTSLSSPSATIDTVSLNLPNLSFPTPSSLSASLTLPDGTVVPVTLPNSLTSPVSVTIPGIHVAAGVYVLTIGNATASTGSFGASSFTLTDSGSVTQTQLLATPVTLPTRPRTYFIGVVVDPDHQIKQLRNIAGSHIPYKAFTLIRKVGPPIKQLPPAGVNLQGSGINDPDFPNPLPLS